MPYYNEPAFYIDFAQLPAPDVIETIAYEDLLAAYKARVLAANPALASALALEQSATNIILQTEAYGEMLMRARVNAAARAVMLAYATGTDLDNLAAFYNVIRGTGESDTRFRARVQEAAETFNTCGTAGAYRFHAMTADTTLFDAVATKVNDRGGINVTIMASVANPTPTAAQINTVLTYLSQTNRKVLTDVVSVTGPQVTTTSIDAELTLYPGPDAGIVLGNANTALTTLRTKVARLGYGLDRSAIITALFQEGVQNVNLISPPADLAPGANGCVLISSATITPLQTRTF